MSERTNMVVGLVMMALLLVGAVPARAADEALDKSFDALKTYDWGANRAVLGAIDKAVVASNGKADAQKALEKRLAAVLGTDATGAAKDFVCRKLSLIGSAQSVPALAPLLTDEKLSHMARYALERMSCPESVKAMRGALQNTSGRVKVGVINSLGVRRDAEAVGPLSALLADSLEEVASAAAAALGSIGTSQTAKILGDFQKKAPEGLRLAAADAYLVCAERRLADGKKAEAMLIYKSLAKPDQPKHVRLAAMRGLLAATGKK